MTRLSPIPHSQSPFPDSRSRIPDPVCPIDSGFTLIELLVAMTVTMLLAGALLGTLRPVRDAFDRVPAELDAQQRVRTALDTISQAVRSADGHVLLSDPDESGVSSELTAVIPIAGSAQGVLEVDQGSPDGAITLATTPCPDMKDVCGFVAGDTALIIDSAGTSDVFMIASVNAASRRVMPAAALSQAYPARSRLIHIDQYTFRLDEQSDESYSLIRETAAGAIQPIVDGIDDLSFQAIDDRIEIAVSLAGRISITSAKWRPAP